MAASGPARLVAVPPIPPAVLVLCQRSRGLLDSITLVQNTIVPAILDFVEERYGPEFRIRFLAPCDDSNGEYTDYNVTLDQPNLPTVEIHMERDQIDSFDFVILHTCPTILMDFEAIWRVMSPNGIMVMTQYNSISHLIQIVTKKRKYSQLHEETAAGIVARIGKYFNEIVGRDGYYIRKTVVAAAAAAAAGAGAFPVVNECDFHNYSQGKKPKRHRPGRDGGGKKKGRKNTLRYKPKKYRSYHRTKRSGSKKLK
jgi:hypothetical protein